MQFKFYIKTIFIFLFVLCFHYNAKSQSVVFENTRLDSALNEITNTFLIKFAFDNELVSGYYITGSFTSTDIRDELNNILSPYNLSSELLNNVFIIFPIEEVSKSYNLLGIVKDIDTGESLPFAHISGANSDFFTVTNQDGYFSVLDLKIDTLDLVISYVGYKPAPYKVKLGDQKQVKKFFLESKKQAIKEVVIKAEKEKESTFQIDDSPSLATINSTSIQNFPGIGERDALRLIQMLPGIKGTNESSADIIIRGGTMDQNLLLFDDFSLYHTDHFYGLVSSLNPKAIKHIQVYKGGFDARYGGRINSVINIVGKQGNRVKPSVDFGLNLLSGNLAVEVPLFKRGALFVSGRRSFTDYYQTALYKQLYKSAEEMESYYSEIVLTTGGEDKEPSFYYYDFNSKLTYNVTDKDNLSISYFLSKDKLTRGNLMPGSDLSNNDVLKNNGLSLRWGKQWNDKLYTKFLISSSEFFNEFITLEKGEYNSEPISYKIENSNQLKEDAFKINNEYKLNDHVYFDYGYEYVNQIIDYSFKYGYDDYEYIGNKIKNRGKLYSGYFQTRLKDIKGLNFSLGFRESYYKQTDNYYFEPRIKLSYGITKNLKFKSAFGIYRQYIVKVFTNNWHSNSKNLWFTSRENDIPVSKSKQFVIGLKYEKNDFLIDVEYFNKDISGLVKYVYNYTLMYDSYSDSYYYLIDDSFNKGSAEIEGLDVLISKSFRKFHAWISYTISDNRNTYKVLNNGIDFHSVYDQKHEFKIAGNQSIKKFKIGFSWIYGSGFSYSGPYYAYDNTKGYSGDEELPDYHKLDLNLIYNFQLGKVDGEIGASLLNVYNRDNKRIKEYVPIIYENNTYYDLNSKDLISRALSLHINFNF